MLLLSFLLAGEICLQYVLQGFCHGHWDFHLNVPGICSMNNYLRVN
jgi:hypothetical protein